jgi:hypothetical protein
MVRVLALCASLLLVAGCATPVSTKYNTDFDNVGLLRAAGVAPVKIGPITKDPGAKQDVDSISLRLAKLDSPYGTYTGYLQEALQQDFDNARLLDASSLTEVTGVLLHNDVEAGVSTGTADIEARLRVARDGKVLYEQAKTAHVEWDSNFVAAIAVPRAEENYPKVLQKLLGEFYRDPQFIAALKH